MEQLPGGYTLNICENAFPLSTDSMLLADFVRLPKNACVLDLGSGCGTLGTLLCARDLQCTVTGIEIDRLAHCAALDNIERNRLSHRMQSIWGDLADMNTLVSPGSFSCCVSNPPYFSSGPASKNRTAARREDSCTLKQLFYAAAWAIKFGGDFFLVHRPERLAELIHCACQTNLEPKRLCLVRHTKGSPVSLVLVHCRKGAKPGLSWEELYLFQPDGSPSEAYKKIYHL